MKTFLLILILVLLAALFFPGVAFALGVNAQEPAPAFEFPPALEIALVGALSAFITQGLKDRFPKIADALAVLVSAIVSTTLGILTGLITTSVSPLFWPLITQGAIALAIWLTSIGTYRVYIRPRLKAQALTIAA